MAQANSIEMFMRWKRDRSVYEFKLTEDAPAVEFTELKAIELLKTVQGEQHKILKFLFDEAKKDPKGTWVSASSAPAVPGQGMVCSRAHGRRTPLQQVQDEVAGEHRNLRLWR